MFNVQTFERIDNSEVSPIVDSVLSINCNQVNNALESAAHFDSDLDSDYDSDDDKCSVKFNHPFTIRDPFQLNERKDIAMRVRGFVLSSLRMT